MQFPSATERQLRRPEASGTKDDGGASGGLFDYYCGLAAGYGCGQAAAAIVGGESEHAMDKANVAQVDLPALVAEVRADEGDIFPVDAVERLRGAGDGEIFDAHIVGENARHGRLENFGAGGHAGGVEKIAAERRGIEQRADG